MTVYFTCALITFMVCFFFFFFLMIRRPPRSTPVYSSAASDVYKGRTVGTTAAIPGNSLAAIISAVPVDSVESNVAQEHEPSGNDALQAMLASVPNGNGNDGAPDAEQLPPVLSRDAAFHINDYTRRQKGKKEVLACLTDRRDGTKATPFTIPGLSVDA